MVWQVKNKLALLSESLPKESEGYKRHEGADHND